MDAVGLRRRKKVENLIKTLDAFPKVQEDCQVKSARGGFVSIGMLATISLLVISEFLYYRETDITYEYRVDQDADSKLKIHLDITVAMPCEYLGADVIDVSGSTVTGGDQLNFEPTLFEMDDDQHHWWSMLQLMKPHLDYRNIYDVDRFQMVASGGDLTSVTAMPSRRDQAMDRDLDACRVHGSIVVNKVTGNLHITLGRIGINNLGHVHMGFNVPPNKVNLSHRIDHFSFGDKTPGVIHPLDGDLVITKERNTVQQYFVQVVPTVISMKKRSAIANQYSVTQRARVLSSSDSGIPGIFFRYEMSSFMVEVVEKPRGFWAFVVRLCGIVGGVFTTSGVVHSFAGFLLDSISGLLESQKRRKDGR